MKTVRVRRSRPSPVALALTLMITMLVVYLLTLGSRPADKPSASASAAGESRAELRLEPMSRWLVVRGEFDSAGAARIAAAGRAEAGQAGWVLRQGERWLVIDEVCPLEADARAAAAGESSASGPGEASADTADAADSGARASCLAAPGLTLQLRGGAAEIQAVSSAVDFLGAQARELDGLSNALGRGTLDARSAQSLIAVYRTQGERARDALAAIAPQATTEALRLRCDAALSRLPDADAEQIEAALRCAAVGAQIEWIALQNALIEG